MQYRVVRRFILHAKRTGFVVEHDFIMATYLADRVIVFEGTPSAHATAHAPQSLLNGMNRFLELLGITFRRDPNNFRPRINKHASVKVYTLFSLVILSTVYSQLRKAVQNAGYARTMIQDLGHLVIIMKRPRR